ITNPSQYLRDIPVKPYSISTSIVGKYVQLPNIIDGNQIWIIYRAEADGLWWCRYRRRTGLPHRHILAAVPHFRGLGRNVFSSVPIPQIDRKSTRLNSSHHS